MTNGKIGKIKVDSFYQHIGGEQNAITAIRADYRRIIPYAGQRTLVVQPGIAMNAVNKPEFTQLVYFHPVFAHRWNLILRFAGEKLQLCPKTNVIKVTLLF
jgi:hypothetical protein